MKAAYNIQGLGQCGRLGMNGWAFQIQLYPSWPEAVAASQLTQGRVNEGIANMGRKWLDACGYDAIFDPDNCGAFKEDKPPGPSAHPLYDPRTSIRVQWGEWGPEHITVPGSACGLDISDSIGSPRVGTQRGRVLLPHNIDSSCQAMLLLVVFTWFADSVTLFVENPP